jgi:hypothetical protein
MLSLRTASLVCAAAALVGACATSSTVHTADGSEAHDISCIGGHFACGDEAKRVCGGRPYVVLDDDGTLEFVSKSQQGSMRVQCVDDYVAANAPAAQPPATSAARPSDQVACRAAFREVRELARAWGTARGLEPSPSSPSLKSFLAACLSLPDEAQFCLVASYRHAHPTCPKVLGALNEAAKRSVDDVLLVARPPEQSPDSAGTLNL